MGESAKEPERTDDGRYIIVGGRRWRASDPAIPEKLRAELVGELMLARRLVKSEGDAVRHRVHDAKLALGERGHPWWEPRQRPQLDERIAATIRALLRHRTGTICPSDAAKVAGGDDWRTAMDAVREVATTMATSGVVAIQQRGETVTGTPKGPIRIARGRAFPA